MKKLLSFIIVAIFTFPNTVAAQKAPEPLDLNLIVQETTKSTTIVFIEDTHAKSDIKPKRDSTVRKPNHFQTEKKKKILNDRKTKIEARRAKMKERRNSRVNFWTTGKNEPS